MNKEKDYYKVLGINRTADKKEIKKAYRELARKYHPDVNRGNRLSEEKFKEIGEAFSVLGDDKTRLQYDILKGFIDIKPQTGEQTKKQASKAYSGKKARPETAGKKQDNPFNMDLGDILKGFTGKFAKDDKKPGEEKKETAEKKAKTEPQKPQPKKGEDITAEISITPIEAHNGTIRKVNILRTDTCGRCRGKRIINGVSCSTCSGKGEVSTHKQLNVKIPPKINEGSKIKINSEGNKGLNGGENGDLYLHVHIIKSSYFTFEGTNVLCEVPITPTEAALGAEIQVPSVDGFINLKIPPETRSGQKFKLAGEGLPDAGSGRRGDQITTVRIDIPSNLTDKEKELFIELAKARKYNPREHIIFDR